MVSLGVIVVTTNSAGELSLGESLYLEIKPQAPKFDARAAAIHGLDQSRLAKEGLSRRQAMINLADWVVCQTRPNTQPTFVGHNAPFDWSYIAWSYAAENLDNPFGYKALCTKSLAMGALSLHWLDTSKETLQRRLGLPKEDHTKKHRADYDARYQGLLLIELMNTMRNG